MPGFPRGVGLLPTFTPVPTTRPMFRSMAIAASGLSAQRARIETIATNLANAETTRTASGGAYQRQVAVLQAATAQTQPLGAASAGPPPLPPIGGRGGIGGTSGTDAGDDPRAITVPVLGGDDGQHGVRVAEVAQDTSDGPLVYDPGHPDADANGYVRYPNVRVSDEMIDLIDARRIYEANATVFQSAKAMLKRAIDI